MALPIETLERHRAFWDRQPADRPLLGVNVGFALQDVFPRAMARIADGPVRPDDIPVEEFLRDCDALDRSHRGLGDYPFVSAPFVALPWLEAVAGCPIVASRNSFWAEPCVRAWRDWRWLDSFLDTPWARKLLDLMDTLAAHAAGRYPVTHTLMRGPSDILAAMRGGAQCVMDLLDDPDGMRPAIDQASRLWRDLAAAQLARIPASPEGYVAGAAALRTWAPDKAVWLQEDAMALLSPALYADFVLPADRRLSDAFPCVAFHLHGSALWAIEPLVRLPGVRVIELNLEDATCDVEGTFAGWRAIQRHKPAIAWRMYGRDFEPWLNRVLSELPWDGLSIQVSARDRAEAETVQRVFTQSVERWAERRGNAATKKETTDGHR
jgi:hypothetical protein